MTMNIGYATEWSGMIVSGMMVPNGMGLKMYGGLVFMAWKGATSAPVLAAGMNAGSQWHKSTFGRPDRDGLHPPPLFSNKKQNWTNEKLYIF